MQRCVLICCCLCDRYSADQQAAVDGDGSLGSVAITAERSVASEATGDRVAEDAAVAVVDAEPKVVARVSFAPVEEEDGAVEDVSDDDSDDGSGVLAWSVDLDVDAHTPASDVTSRDGATSEAELSSEAAARVAESDRVEARQREGHVFILWSDMLKVACDAFLLPTNRNLRVSRRGLLACSLSAFLKSPLPVARIFGAHPRIHQPITFFASPPLSCVSGQIEPWWRMDGVMTVPDRDGDDFPPDWGDHGLRVIRPAHCTRTHNVPWLVNVGGDLSVQRRSLSCELVGTKTHFPLCGCAGGG